MWCGSSDMIERHTLNHIWLDWAGTLVKSEVKVSAATRKGKPVLQATVQ
jgi:hypothetical protein